MVAAFDVDSVQDVVVAVVDFVADVVVLVAGGPVVLAAVLVVAAYNVDLGSP